MSGKRTDSTEEASVLAVRGRVPFAMAPKALIRGSELSAQAIRLWMVLDSYTYGESETAPAPSRAQLAKDCDVRSIRSIAMYLRELQDAGWLTIEHQYRDNGGQGQSRYVLEWTPRAAAEHPRPGATEPTDLFDGGVIAGQHGGQNSALGGSTQNPPIVDNSVIAYQHGGQYSARGVPPGQDSALPPGQNSAHPYRNENLTTKKTTTTMAGDSGGYVDPAPGLPGVDGGGGSPPAGSASSPPRTAAGQALAAVVRDAVPASLGGQANWRVVGDRCVVLADMGWDPASVRAAVTARSWSGAGPGALVRHLEAMGDDGPPDAEFPTRSRRPPWCGECDDDRTRHIQLADGRVARCPHCHPMSTGGNSATGTEGARR